MIDKKINPEIIEEATDPLGAGSNETSEDDSWTPDDLNEKQRQQDERGLAAVDDFIATNPRYRQTESNRELILGYLADHDLPLSPASLCPSL